MDLKVFIVLYVLVLTSKGLVQQTGKNRDKRTLDVVLRGVADIFGYDVQKRPTVIPPTTTAKPAPPPLPRPPPPPRPPPRVIPPKLPIPIPQAPITAPPLLTETVRKRFNVNINWNKNVNPVTVAPAAPAPPKAAPPAAPAPSQAAPPAAPPPRPSQPKKPELYHEYNYEQDQPENRYVNYEDTDDDNLGNSLPYEQEEGYDEPDYVQEYSETSKEFQRQPYTGSGDHENSKQRYKDTAKSFWKNYPLKEEYGYKYIEPTESGPLRISFPQDFSKYEEYDIAPNSRRNYPNKQNAINYVGVGKNNAPVTPKTYYEQQGDDSNFNYFSVPTESDFGFISGFYFAPKSTPNTDTHFFYNFEEIGPKTKPAPKAAGLVITRVRKPTKPPVLAQNSSSIAQNSSTNQTTPTNQTNHIIQPLLTGILPIRLHELEKSGTKVRAWPAPFDYEFGGSQKRPKFAKNPVLNLSARKRSVDDEEGEVYSFQFKPEKINYDALYTVPEPAPYDYAQHEKLTFQDEDDLSDKAKVTSKQTKVSVVRTNQYVT